jgi:DNA polymerase III delta subunit
VWVVQSALLRGEASEAVRAINEAVNVSGHHPTLVTFACLDLARKLNGACRGLRAGENAFQLAGKLKIWNPAQKDAILALARRADPVRLGALLKAAVEADHRQKTGQSEGSRSLEALALKFADSLAG